ncbi:MAG TPA: FAD-binding oxidoreductase, partial [Candidatus Coprovivens excrementavium]|nr:FAD-binding oxidoreductase [Candidatus Coprovivens excrementavium]
MKYQSLWLEDKSKRKYPSLKNNLNVDILIIGGGITGLSIAYFLRDKGYKIALVERDKIGIGASGRNTGKITYLQGTIYSDLCNMYNDEVAKEYLYSQDLAISLIRNIILDEKIKCN